MVRPTPLRTRPRRAGSRQSRRPWRGRASGVAFRAGGGNAARMEWTGVSSTSVDAVAYDAATATLYLRFAGGGAYAYFGVPPSVHRELLTADSVGGYVNRVVKPRYPFRPL